MQCDCVFYALTMFNRTSINGKKQKLGFSYTCAKPTTVKAKKDKIVKVIWKRVIWGHLVALLG